MQRILQLCICLVAAQLYRAARVPEPMQLQDLIKRSWNTPPNFPDAYEMEYNFTMPYFLLLQPQGLSYPVHVWVDKAAQSVRIDFRGGIDRTYFVKKEEYSVTPHKDKLVCSEYSHGGGPVRKTLSLPQGMLGKQVLPDMSEWVDFGPAKVDGFKAHMWQKKNMAGEKVNTYTFYISEAGTPIKFHSVGQDYFGGSHYDEYIYEWTMFKPGPVDPAVFEIPDLCKKDTQAQLISDSSSSSGERHHKALQAVALLPGNHLQHQNEALYHGWCHFHNRQHTDTTDYTNRLATFTANKAKVVAHNMKVAAAAADTAGPTSDVESDVPGHTLKLNHFADWSREEFDRVMLPKKWKREHGIKQEQVRASPLRTFKSALAKSKFPKNFDWRATPADFAVKDQGQCGSCWAFAAVGTMEGSWFVATGTPRSFSEQQLIDCAWDEGPSGCDGGEYQDAFRYIEKSSGIAATQDYPYVGQNDYCRDTNAKLSGHFTGYIEVESRSEESVMEALMRYGPLAVGVDATFDDFLFYSEGIYRHKGCGLKPRDLDHAVILVGWGTDKKTDEKYWVVKNSWSKYWGDDGYIKIHRGGNDCGIASDAVFAEVSADYIVPGASESALQLVLGKAQLP